MHKTNFEFLFQSGIKSCIFHCKVKMSIHLESIIKFGDVNWKCVGLISDSWESFFKIKDRWFKDNSELPPDACMINNVIIAVFNQVNQEGCNEDESFCYTGSDLIKIRSRTNKRKQDVKKAQKRYEETKERKQAKKEYE